MTPKQRQHAILEIVKKHRVKNLRELSKLLIERGCSASHATLSRDISELGLVKGAAGYVLLSSSRRELTSTRMAQRLSQVHVRHDSMLRKVLLSVEAIGNQVVVKTTSAAADAATDVIDDFGWSEVAGTIAGFDTILMITRNQKHAKIVAKRIQQIIGHEHN